MSALRPLLVPSGPSPAGNSLLGPAGRCPALWAFSQPPEGPDVPTRTEDVFDPGAGDRPASSLHTSMHLPFVKGILAHDALAQTWRRQQALMDGQDPATWATWDYALVYGLAWAAEEATFDPARWEATERRGHSIAAWVSEAPAGSRMRRLMRAAEHTRPDMVPVIEAVARWHRNRWRQDDRVAVVDVERALHLWLDPDQQDDLAADPRQRYGVVDPPADEPQRLALYRALRGPDWRAALRFLGELGPPWLLSSRLDMMYREGSRLYICDLKTGHKAGSKGDHLGYQNSLQLQVIDVWGRCFLGSEYSGFVIEYLPWHGKAGPQVAAVAEVHRRSLAWTAAQRWKRLIDHVHRPVSRWERVADMQGCRTIYDDPCQHYDRCRSNL